MPILPSVRTALARAGALFRTAPATPKRTLLFGQQAVDPFFRVLNELSDPDEILVRAGLNRASLRALTGDDEITQATETRIDALLATPWRLEIPGVDSDEELPEPVKWMWTQMDRWAESILRCAMEALWYGYSVQEAVYQYDATGRITWAEVTEKPFEWFIPRLDGTVLYRSRAMPTGEEVSPLKFFLTARRQTYRNQQGEALFSRLYWPWFFRQQGWRFWVRWLERFGSPMLVGKTGGSADAMAEALAKAVQSATVAVGMGDEVAVVESAGQGGGFEGFERAVTARVQKLILGQTLTSDAGGSSGKSGSYALGEVHNEVRRDKRDSDIRMVTKTAQRAIDALWFINRFPGDAPRFVMADDTGLEADRADRDSKLANAGIVRFTKDYLLRTYDFEPEDIEEVEPEPPAAGTGMPGQDKAKGKGRGDRFAAGRRFTRPQQAIEDAVAGVLPDLGQALDDEAIHNAIRAATDPADLIDRLSVLLDGTTPGTFQIVVERALFAADLLGYVHAREEGPPPQSE